MLEAIRNRSTGIVIKGLLALLILSFAVWGIADVFTPGGTNQTVATVGESEVSPDEIRRDFNRELDRLSGMLGTRLDSEQARAFGIADNVLNRIVDRTLFSLAASDQGIVISDDLVRGSIRAIPEFNDANGNFDRLRFQQALQNNRLTEAGFVALTRGDMMRRQYLSMVGAAPAAPKRMAEILFAYRNEKRIAEVVTIPYSAQPNPADPTDTQLAEFHTANAARFTAPEYRKLTVVSLTADQLAKEISLSDDEIAAAYESRRDEFLTPESRVLKQIRIGDEIAAKKAHDMLKGGADFATVAKDVADMSADQLDLGAMTKAQLLPGLAEAAFGLQPGHFSEPVKSVLGWHILSLVEIKAEQQQSLEETKEGLAKELAAEKAIDSLYQVANMLEDELGGGGTLEEAAKTLNLPIRTIPAIGRSGLSRKDTPVDNLPHGDFLGVAFDTLEGHDSPLTEAGSDGYYIVRVDSVTLPELRSLASIHNDVLAAWQEEQRVMSAKKLADDIIAQVKSGSQLDKLATEHGLTVTLSTSFTRSESVKDLSPSLVNALFSSSIGSLSEGVGNGAHVVARLTDVKAANPVADKEKMDDLRKQLTSSMRSDLIGQLSGGLRQEHPVSINPAALNALF